MAYRMPATPVEIQGKIGDEEVMWNGVFNRFDGIGIDETTKTIPCAIDVKNPLAETKTGKKPLVRGMFVTVRVVIDTTSLLESGTQLIQFPAVAVHPGDFVWVVSQGILERRHVDVIDRIQLEDTSANAGEPTMLNPDDPENLNFHKVMVVVRVRDNNIRPGDKIIVTPLAQPTVGAKVIESGGAQ